MSKILILFFVLSSQVLIAQGWQRLPDFSSHARDDGSVFVINNKAYCGLGLAPWWSTLGDFQMLDMATDTWSPMAAIPTGEERQYAAGFSANGVGYIFGGTANNKYLNDLWQYDPNTDSWKEMTSLPDTGRSAAAHFVLNDTAYLIGGKTKSQSATKQVWAYDIINDTWIQKSDFPFAKLWLASGASWQNKGYVIFGVNENGTYQNQLYQYIVGTDTWQIISTFPQAGRNYASMNAIAGQLVIFGGRDSSGVFHRNLWRYDINSGMWSQGTGIPAKGRKGGLSFTNGTSLYYTTGIDSSHTRLNETWKCSNPLIGVREIKTSSFALYPNPATNELTIELEGFINNTEIVAVLYSGFGGKVASWKLNNQESRLNVSAIKSGIYLLKIKSDKQESTQLIVID